MKPPKTMGESQKKIRFALCMAHLLWHMFILLNTKIMITHYYYYIIIISSSSSIIVWLYDIV